MLPRVTGCVGVDGKPTIASQISTATRRRELLSELLSELPGDWLRLRGQADPSVPTH